MTLEEAAKLWCPASRVASYSVDQAGAASMVAGAVAHNRVGLLNGGLMIPPTMCCIGSSCPLFQMHPSHEGEFYCGLGEPPVKIFRRIEARAPAPQAVAPSEGPIPPPVGKDYSDA